MKFYVAASYGRKIEAARLADDLGVAGHIVVARWIYKSLSDTPAKSWAAARECLEDVREADVLILLSLPKGTHAGGGRYVEYGYARALEKPIIVLGPLGETIFHFAPRVYQANTHREVVSLMARISPDGSLSA